MNFLPLYDIVCYFEGISGVCNIDTRERASCRAQGSSCGYVLAKEVYHLTQAMGWIKAEYGWPLAATCQETTVQCKARWFQVQTRAYHSVVLVFFFFRGVQRFKDVSHKNSSMVRSTGRYLNWGKCQRLCVLKALVNFWRIQQSHEGEIHRLHFLWQVLTHIIWTRFAWRSYQELQLVTGGTKLVEVSSTASCILQIESHLRQKFYNFRIIA